MVDHSRSYHLGSTILLPDSHHSKVLLASDLHRDLDLRARCQVYLQHCHQAFRLAMGVDDKESR